MAKNDQYEIIAKQGDDRWLVRVGPEGSDKAQIYDSDMDTLFPEFNIHSILARGYWDAVDKVPEDVQKAIDALFSE